MGRFPKTSWLLATGLSASLALAADHRGSQFFGWSRLDAWQHETPATGEEALTSPVVKPAVRFNEVVLSWNAEAPAGTGLAVEARAIYPDRATRFYALGCWASQPGPFPRASVKDQEDADGEVRTDTLVLRRPCQRVQVRVRLQTRGPALPPKVKFVGLSLLDRGAAPATLPPNRAAWGRMMDVPRRSQVNYPGGQDAWCSPASISMVLAYWARELQRPELDHDVPAVAQGVFDPNLDGTGNWPFNTAFAGAWPGLRAYVTRLSDVSELEDWIAQDIPVVISVCYDLLRGLPRTRESGHLVVCVGFTATGEIIVNDPGTRQEIRRTFPRANLIKAWANSRNTVYLIYPESRQPPRDRFGHWYAPIQ